MDINYIFENEDLMKLLHCYIEKTYYKYKLSFIIEKEDFIQEVYIYLIPRIKSFDNEKSTLKTYLPIVIMSCAKNCIQKANGNSTKANKLKFNNNTVSMDEEFKNDGNSTLKDLIGISEDIGYIHLIIDEILNKCKLSPRQKLVIKLMSKGYTKTDIANILNVTSCCVNITFARAKEKIVHKYTL